MMHTCQEKMESLSPKEALYTTLDLTMFVFHLLIAAHPAAEQFLSETYSMHKHGYLSAFSAQKRKSFSPAWSFCWKIWKLPVFSEENLSGRM